MVHVCVIPTDAFARHRAGDLIEFVRCCFEEAFLEGQHISHDGLPAGLAELRVMGRRIDARVIAEVGLGSVDSHEHEGFLWSPVRIQVHADCAYAGADLP